MYIIVIFVIGIGSCLTCLYCVYLCNSYNLLCIEIQVIPSTTYIVVFNN